MAKWPGCELSLCKILWVFSLRGNKFSRGRPTWTLAKVCQMSESKKLKILTEAPVLRYPQMLSLNTNFTFKSNNSNVSTNASTLNFVVRWAQRIWSPHFTVQNRKATLLVSAASPAECYGKVERDFYPLQHCSEDDILHLYPIIGNACVPLLLPSSVGTVSCPQKSCDNHKQESAMAHGPWTRL